MNFLRTTSYLTQAWTLVKHAKLECGPMPTTGGAVCSTPQFG